MKRKTFLLVILLSAGIFILCILASPAQKEEAPLYDVLIKNGKVLDGSLKPEAVADVAIKDGQIVKIARSITGKANRVINAKGLYVTPGFIDLHTHVDEGMYFPENRSCLNYLKQGVTTVIVGQCGSSAWPIFEKAEDLVKLWSEEGIGPNAALLVGHGTVRENVMGMDNREPTPEELEKMKDLVREAMEQGAYGLSTGLIYMPGIFAKTDEVIELAKVAAPYGGVYHTHIRNEREKLLDAVREALEISEKSGAPVHISHFKVMEKKNWGLIREACTVVEEARVRGVKVTADQYPYQFTDGYPYQSLIPRQTWLGRDDPKGLAFTDLEPVFDFLRDSQLLDLYTKVTPYIPISEHHQQFLDTLPRKRLVSLAVRSLVSIRDFRGSENARERMLFLKRMQNPEKAQKIRQEVRGYIENSVGAENFVVGICVEKNLEGKSLAQAAVMKGKSVEDTAIDLELIGAKCIPLRMCEDDIEYIMKRDYVGTGSDGTSPPYGIDLTHIRSYSTFLHKIKKYALERKAVSLAHVIRSQTSLPAQIMNWDDRGWVKEGCKADIAVIDIANIKTPTSISNPHAYSQGVQYLLINGQLVLDNGQWKGKLSGQVIKLKKS